MANPDETTVVHFAAQLRSHSRAASSGNREQRCDTTRRTTGLQSLRDLQANLRPHAEAAGYFSDDDFFRDFS